MTNILYRLHSIGFGTCIKPDYSSHQVQLERFFVEMLRASFHLCGGARLAV